MRKGKYGKIINVGSTTSMFGLPERLHYVTAKGAVHAMTRALAREVGPGGIRINTIAYGLITNPVTEADFKAHPGKHKMMMAKRALGLDVFADDLVGSLIYLASADSDAMTGQCLIVDAGEVLD
jgi:NAD(P)-dependent dehydrogenase (short-subunit alcohol dehydrogenase family)